MSDDELRRFASDSDEDDSDSDVESKARSKNKDDEDGEGEEGDMICCLICVPRGAMKEDPEYEGMKAEVDSLVAQQSKLKISMDGGDDDEEDEDGESGESKAGQDDEDGEEESDAEIAKPEAKKASKKGKDDDDDDEDDEFMKSLKLDEYDDEEEGAELFLGGEKISVFASNTEDPYITLPDEEDAQDEEEARIKPIDSVFVVGRLEAGYSQVEVWVYDEETANMYNHHSFDLPSAPVALAWLGADPRGVVGDNKDDSGSFAAVAMMQNPGIELWNLDVMDALEPVCILGGYDEGLTGGAALAAAASDVAGETVGKKKKNKKKKKKSAVPRLKEGSHQDTVTALASTTKFRTRLASGSVDRTVKIWDIQAQKCTQTFRHHKDRVQSLDFHPVEPNILISGGPDRTVKLFDVRAKEGKVATFAVDGEVESCRWALPAPGLFMASTGNGQVFCFDATKPGKPVFRLQAHDKAVTNVSFCSFKGPTTPFVFATSSEDKMVKVWEVKDSKPVQLSQQKMKELGQVLCMSFYPESLLIAAGGDTGKVAVWDARTESAVASRFAPPKRKSKPGAA